MSNQWDEKSFDELQDAILLRDYYETEMKISLSDIKRSEKDVKESYEKALVVTYLHKDKFSPEGKLLLEAISSVRSSKYKLQDSISNSGTSTPSANEEAYLLNLYEFKELEEICNELDSLDSRLRMLLLTLEEKLLLNKKGNKDLFRSE